MFPVAVPRVFKNAGRITSLRWNVVESLFIKVTGEISAFCSSVENFNTSFALF